MDNKEFTKLINIGSRIDTDILISQLQAAGIETMVKTPGAGDYLNILGYGTALGQDIYVIREDYNVAMEIAKEFKETDGLEPGKIKKARQIVAIIILLGILGGFLMSIFN